MVNRYSLSDHTAVITFPAYSDQALAIWSGQQIRIGGPGNNNQYGSFVGSITVERNADAWSTEGDPTGSWVHNKNLNKTGTVSIDIRQVSDSIVTLTNIARLIEDDTSAAKGFDIVIYSSTKTVATAQDCYIQKIPGKVFGETAANQTWVFTSGRIVFNEEGA